MTGADSGALSVVSLDDKYTVEQGEVYLNGIQALARLPLDQARRDRRAGLNTGVLVTGYEGSPLGSYDLALERMHHLLDPLNVVHAPAVNEEMAVGAIMGSQMLHHFPKPKVDGVVGFWYGKSPGVERSGDAFRHANLGGGGRCSAAVAIAGDDPAAKSSTVPGQSEYAFLNVGMPVLAPSTVGEMLELGLYAVAMSRFAGLWVALKAPTNLCDGGGVITVGPDRPVVVVPSDFTVEGRPYQKADNFIFLPPATVDMERHLYHERHEAVLAFARVNALNEIVTSSPGDRLGIVTAGKTTGDVIQSLLDCGLDGAELQRLGVRVLRLGMIYPVEPGIVRRFAEGLEEVIVVEEKRDFLESQIRSILYDLPRRPKVVGKRDENGSILFPMYGEMDADMVTERLAPRLLRLERREGVARRLEQLQIIRHRPYEIFAIRRPNYCSGCPHNRSTVAVDGEVIGGGIGCHSLTGLQTQPERQISYLTQMGGEGAPFIGMSPFTETEHFFQNIGDGTFFHSGSLGVRAAVAAGINTTFKILFNRTVAMTGGQAPEGGRDVPDLTRLLEAEGVKRTIVVAEEPERYDGLGAMAPNAVVYERERYTDAIRELKAVTGVSALIYDQMCANEKRRLRKRGRMEDPNRFVVINEEVCEGCGHCGEVSNCMSVQPVETEFGRKTRIHQSSCNKDYSCLGGDCPSFLVVEARGGAGLAKKRPPVLQADDIPEPRDRKEIGDSYHIYIPGIGGTGVVTVNALLCYAAVMEGVGVINLDQTGLAQKGGAVLSSVVLTNKAGRLRASNKVGVGKADLLLVLDMLGGVTQVNLDRASPDRTVVVADVTGTPTGEMVRHVDMLQPRTSELREAVDRYTRASDNVYLEGGDLAEKLFGDHMAINLFMLGAAYQCGFVPLSAGAIEQAILLNGVAVEQNTQAFRYGRLQRHDPARVRALVDPPPLTAGEEQARALESMGRESREGRAYRGFVERCARLDQESQRLLAIRVAELIKYQNAAYAEDYVRRILAVADREAEVVPGEARLTQAAIRHLYKLMAYKDEYEVARLHLKDSVKERLDETFGGAAKVKVALHPPILRSLGMKDKLELGPWFRPFLRMLVPMRRLRGTAWDPFGRTRVRREERALVQWYEGVLDQVMETLSAGNHETAVEIAGAPDGIRGYEEIKMRNAAKVRERVSELLPRLAEAEAEAQPVA